MRVITTGSLRRGRREYERSINRRKYTQLRDTVEFRTAFDLATAHPGDRRHDNYERSKDIASMPPPRRRTHSEEKLLHDNSSISDGFPCAFPRPISHTVTRTFAHPSRALLPFLNWSARSIER